LRDVRVTHQVVLDTGEQKAERLHRSGQVDRLPIAVGQVDGVPLSVCIGGLGCDPTGAEPGFGTPGDEQGERHSCAGDGLAGACPHVLRGFQMCQE
jgi:hypothetical protein